MPSENKYEYSCLMLLFDLKKWSEFQQKLVNKSDLYNIDGQYGFEDEPHVTILYGLHDDVSFQDVKKHLLPITDFKIVCNKIGIFESEFYDVLKFEVQCDPLHNLNSIIKNKFPYTSKFPKYLPHITIAYLKPGMGQKYINKTFNPLKLTPSRYKYSHADGSKEYFKKY